MPITAYFIEGVVGSTLILAIYDRTDLLDSVGW
ncbi:hypothetical protein CA13_16340 [Planctomycetes bacterium CA13]|uniref:Uncharacterized protein n=1 Tax=Novipirellula herctigrandis TaxID=2527986 RepID=A0A5C5Z064_9BACT|nr:hypothetical protein CA13_16340 [Planctomycetes bacterium CA13]